MSILDDFEEIDQEAIDEFVRTQQEEHLHLDFKAVGSADLTRDDRKNLAKSISGFANSDGGVIIWGVDARQNSEGVDGARATRPIENLDRFMSRLRHLAGEAVSPAVPSVRHRPIPIQGTSKGFAATLIPASDGGPHQAKLGEDRYYKRSGDRFSKMEHFEIEDMFGRRPRPDLFLMHRVIHGGEPSSDRRSWEWSVVLGIGNCGRGSAHAPMLAIAPKDPWFRRTYGIDGNRTEGLERLPAATGSQWIRYGGSGLVVLHAGAEIAVCAVTCRLRTEISDPFDLRVRYQIAADGVRMIEDELVLAGGRLAEESRELDQAMEFFVQVPPRSRLEAPHSIKWGEHRTGAFTPVFVAGPHTGTSAP